MSGSVANETQQNTDVNQVIDYKSRMCPQVSYPLCNLFLKEEEIFQGKLRIPNADNILKHFHEEGRILPEHAIEIIQRAKELFAKEPNTLILQEPINVCGDIHGQYYDLLKLFSIGGNPSKTQYLFLGDYVDRGCFGMECVLLLFTYKILYPQTFFMLRGNHECRHLTAFFNFKIECEFKYNNQVYNEVMDCFDAIPLAVILNEKYLCIHGGLSPDILAIEDIDTINRFIETPPEGPMCDLMWSDPTDDDELMVDENSIFQYNELRGCSYNFTFAATDIFLKNNNLLSIIRAHEAQNPGYKFYKKGYRDFPPVICIFSAPNYCDSYGNLGAIIKFENQTMTIRQFNQTPHPYYLPNFIDAFQWSIPFVSDKISELASSILQLTETEQEEQEEEVVAKGPPLDKDRAEMIRAKIFTIGRFSRLANLAKEHKDALNQLKDLNQGLIPQGLLFKGVNAIHAAIKDFESAKKADLESEKRPSSSSVGSGSSSSGSSSPVSPSGSTSSGGGEASSYDNVEGNGQQRKPRKGSFAGTLRKGSVIQDKKMITSIETPKVQIIVDNPPSSSSANSNDENGGSSSSNNNNNEVSSTAGGTATATVAGDRSTSSSQ